MDLLMIYKGFPRNSKLFTKDALRIHNGFTKDSINKCYGCTMDLPPPSTPPSPKYGLPPVDLLWIY